MNTLISEKKSETNYNLEKWKKFRDIGKKFKLK